MLITALKDGRCALEVCRENASLQFVNVFMDNLGLQSGLIERAHSLFMSIEISDIYLGIYVP